MLQLIIQFSPEPKFKQKGNVTKKRQLYVFFFNDAILILGTF